VPFYSVLVATSNAEVRRTAVARKKANVKGNDLLLLCVYVSNEMLEVSREISALDQSFIMTGAHRIYHSTDPV
jgi:hypothetical protein